MVSTGIDCMRMRQIPHNSWGIGYLRALLVYFCYIYCHGSEKTYHSLNYVHGHQDHCVVWATVFGRISKILVIFVCSGWLRNCFVFKLQHAVEWCVQSTGFWLSLAVKYTVKYKRNPCACANSRYQAVSPQLWISLGTRLGMEAHTTYVKVTWHVFLYMNKYMTCIATSFTPIQWVAKNLIVFFQWERTPR